MAILDWSFTPAPGIEREFDRLRRRMDDIFARMVPGAGIRAGFPAVNVYEQGDDVLVALHAPGVRKEDLAVDLTENTLSISGKREAPAYPDAEILREECVYGEFQRVVRIPSRVDSGKIEANLKNGILMVRMPKMEEAKTRQIAINA
jgi:HSP20 family protein